MRDSSLAYRRGLTIWLLLLRCHLSGRNNDRPRDRSRASRETNHTVSVARCVITPTAEATRLLVGKVLSADVGGRYLSTVRILTKPTNIVISRTKNRRSDPKRTGGIQSSAVQQNRYGQISVR